ncbi:MAG: hypothetical protein K0R66_1389 [Gammaproteobacteria bacterium]|jgi:hypothetical protein|nr:hypothetical protein [Gammaproteobacteria bacterium]
MNAEPLETAQAPPSFKELVARLAVNELLASLKNYCIEKKAHPELIAYVESVYINPDNGEWIVFFPNTEDQQLIQSNLRERLQEQFGQSRRWVQINGIINIIDTIAIIHELRNTPDILRSVLRDVPEHQVFYRLSATQALGLGHRREQTIFYHCFHPLLKVLEAYSALQQAIIAPSNTELLIQQLPQLAIASLLEGLREYCVQRRHSQALINRIESLYLTPNHELQILHYPAPEQCENLKQAFMHEFGAKNRWPELSKILNCIQNMASYGRLRDTYTTVQEALDSPNYRLISASWPHRIAQRREDSIFYQCFKDFPQKLRVLYVLEVAAKEEIAKQRRLHEAQQARAFAVSQQPRLAALGDRQSLIEW